MHNYKAVMGTMPGSPSWAFDFRETDDETAINRMQTILKSDMVGVRWFREMYLFTTSTADYRTVTFGYERHVATICLDHFGTLVRLPQS